MEYKCQTVPLSSLISSYSGFVNPLCANCKTLDCSNPIEKRKVSVVGVIKDMKVYSRGKQIFIVVDCQGYSI